MKYPMNDTTIILMRHGEVENRKQILYGRMPFFGLTKRGKEKIREKAVELKKHRISAIYASPLLRARITAGIVGEFLNLRPRYSKFITEVGLIFDGMTLEEYKSKYQPFIFSEKYVKKGQESVNDIEKRMFKFFSKIIRNHKGEIILVVTHGDPIVIVKAKLEGIKFTWNYKKNNYLKVGDYFPIIYRNEKYSLI